jgi:hypothetical protein
VGLIPLELGFRHFAFAPSVFSSGVRLWTNLFRI